MIFEQLSLEYWLAGKPLPWNKTANQVIVDVMMGGLPCKRSDTAYFNLKG